MSARIRPSADISYGAIFFPPLFVTESSHSLFLFCAIHRTPSAQRNAAHSTTRKLRGSSSSPASFSLCPSSFFTESSSIGVVSYPIELPSPISIHSRIRFVDSCFVLFSTTSSLPFGSQTPSFTSFVSPVYATHKGDAKLVYRISRFQG